MPSPVFKRYEEILQNMISTVVSRTTLNDVTDTSVFKHLLAGVARELDEAYYQLSLLRDVFSLDTASGEDLDARAAEVSPSTLRRKEATKSVGALVFSRAGTSGTVSIPAGTKAKTSGGVLVQTTEATVIADTFSSSDVTAAVAMEGGVAGNVAAGTLVKFDSKPTGVDSVTNPAPFTGGTDKESDDSFRQRIKDFIASLARSTVKSLEFAAKTVSLSNGKAVRFSHVEESVYNRGEVTLYIDDGAGTAEETTAVVGENLTEGLAGPPADSAVGGEQFLFTNNRPLKTSPAPVFTSSARTITEGTDFIVDHAAGQLYFPGGLLAAEVITGSYTAFTGLVAEVQRVIDGDPLDRETYPGWRAAGVRVTVAVPQVLQQIVQGTVVVQEGFTKSEVITDVKNVIAEYINGLGISGDVVVAEIIQRVMDVDGVINATITAPAEDVTLLDDQLARADVALITIT